MFTSEAKRLGIESDLGVTFLFKDGDEVKEFYPFVPSLLYLCKNVADLRLKDKPILPIRVVKKLGVWEHEPD